MLQGEQGGALRRVQVLFEFGTMGSLTDRQLLEQFRTRAGDAAEAAFACLVERHGPMVIRTCRSVLRDEHAAEDAFQATFMVLVRHARSLWVKESIGPWLYQVATRVASSARAADLRRRRHELGHSTQTKMLCSAAREPDDLVPAIHQELALLPEQFRAAVVLCCIEGLTQQQAAGRLGWPLGTLQSRLARGRARLQARIVRRGLGPSTAVVAALAQASADAAPAVVPVSLASSTVRIAAQLAAGKAGAAALPVVSLSRGVLRTMVLQKLKYACAVLLAVTITGAGAGVWAGHAFRSDSDDASAIVEDSASVSEHTDPPAASENTELAGASEVDPALFLEDASENDEEFTDLQKSDPGKPDVIVDVTIGDGKPDGKRSLGGSGEMIEMGMPKGASKVLGGKIHGSRYGLPQAPKESFLIYFLNADRTRILHTEMAPYSRFKRGPEEWVEIKFESPVVGLPKSFWVIVDFRAAQTKGVYVSFDTTTEGKFSRVGLPGMPSSQVTFGGDWMIQAIFAE